MKAIETRYKGYRFRSRLEARWAVFFDALGLAWEYEPEGFDLGCGGRYLPDFRTTSPQGIVHWYEVKPRHTKQDAKFAAFEDVAQRAGEYCRLLSGDPLDMLSEMHKVCPRCGNVTPAPFDHDELDNCSCWPCDCTTPCGGDHPSEPGIRFQVAPHKGLVLIQEPDATAWDAFVRSAAGRARSARFEHGEAPK